MKTIGRELNVRYVLEGSVQRGGNRMRVNVQLIDAETGNHLWAERFDKPLADLFDMQDEIVARLAGALNAQLVVAEAQRGSVRNESTLVAHDVLDVLGPDMSRLHDLSHCAGGGDYAEDLDEERETERLAMNRAGARGEQLEVGAPEIPEPDERGRQVTRCRSRLVLEQPLLV